MIVNITSIRKRCHLLIDFKSTILSFPSSRLNLSALTVRPSGFYEACLRFLNASNKKTNAITQMIISIIIPSMNIKFNEINKYVRIPKISKNPKPRQIRTPFSIGLLFFIVLYQFLSYFPV